MKRNRWLCGHFFLFLCFLNPFCVALIARDRLHAFKMNAVRVGMSGLVGELNLVVRDVDSLALWPE